MMPFHESPIESFIFSALPIFGVSIFILVFGMIIISVVKEIGQRRHNNAQPVLTVPTTVVAKRTNTSSSRRSDGHHHSGYTSYFVTFQVESGDRMEFQVKDEEYGLLVEKDIGLLTFQGTRYLSFKRKIE